MKLLVITMLLLTACAGPDVTGYRTKAIVDPSKQAQYEKDLGDCKYAVLHPPGNVLYGFGLLGGVAAQATNKQKMYDDFAPFGERVDACMMGKSYKVTS